MHFQIKFIKIAFFSSILMFLSCSKDPDICECMNRSIDAHTRLSNIQGNFNKLKEANDITEKELEPCVEMVIKLNNNEKNKLEKEAMNCSNYTQFISSFD